MPYSISVVEKKHGYLSCLRWQRQQQQATRILETCSQLALIVMCAYTRMIWSNNKMPTYRGLMAPRQLMKNKAKVLEHFSAFPFRTWEQHIASDGVWRTRERGKPHGRRTIWLIIRLGDFRRKLLQLFRRLSFCVFHLFFFIYQAVLMIGTHHVRSNLFFIARVELCWGWAVCGCQAKSSTRVQGPRLRSHVHGDRCAPRIAAQPPFDERQTIDKKKMSLREEEEEGKKSRIRSIQFFFLFFLFRVVT